MYRSAVSPCAVRTCVRLTSIVYGILHRENFRKLSKQEQDMVILSMLQANRRIPGLENEYGTRSAKKSSRHSGDTYSACSITYTFVSLPVCRTFYVFVHEIGIERYRNLIQHYQKHGLCPRTHGNTGKLPVRTNSLTETDISNVVNFIQNHADKYGLALPGRLASCRDLKAIKIPSANTKARLYRLYCAAAKEEPGARRVCLTAFKYLWTKHLPHISPLKPKDDLCDVCRNNVIKIQRSANLNDDDIMKKAAVEEAVAHLEKARKQREYYNYWRKKAMDETEIENDDVRTSFNVLSFDFAEQVHFPSSPQQVGPAYFKTGRKCGIFGVHNERTHQQTNYLIDESDNAGKGANAVISMLDDYLRLYDEGGVLLLFSDNCVGQNKNNALIHYLAWRVATGRNVRIEYNFLLAGHTKFSPDRGFGLVKLAYARWITDCLLDFIECVNASSHNGFNIARPTVDPVTHQRNVYWSLWSTYLSKYFRHVPDITKFHHFLFTPNSALQKKLFIDDEYHSFSIQTTSLEDIDAEVIEDQVVESMSAERQWYLYTEIRPLCSVEEKKDLLAPLPAVPYKRYGSKKAVTESDGVMPRKRGRPPKTSHGNCDVSSGETPLHTGNLTTSQPKKSQPKKRKPATNAAS